MGTMQYYLKGSALARGGGDGGGMDWELRVNRCKLLYIEWINNKDLLYSTGNCTQYSNNL